ncbi:MAG: hypothetical protein GC129_05770 [Proteobacteria bacterium]|nr:hypothetical protein [Pseudomonadota bacterium]
MQLPPLPPAVQNMLDEYLPILRQRWAEAQTHLGPVAQQAVSLAQKFWGQLAEAGTGASVGATFRHLCVVGLNRSELLLAGESQSVFADNWQDLADDNLRRHMALMFFAPRGLDGTPVNPYLFLAGENPDAAAAQGEEGNAVFLAEQSIGNTSLIDLCRISAGGPNTVNIIVAADVLFHWDIKDNYILPTSPTTWVRDVQAVIKSYPRTTVAHIYTQWEADLLTPSDRLKIHRLRDIPLDPPTWLNQPTVQQKYGTYVLTFALLVAGLTYAGLWLKQRALDALLDDYHVVEQQIPRGGQYADIAKAISEQEKMFAKRDLFAVMVKDGGRAIANSGMKVDNFEVRVAEPSDPPKQYVFTIEAEKNAYEGWLQEEPIARAVLMNSALLDAMRKPPTTTGFKLEGITDVATLARAYAKVAPKPNVEVTSSTQPGRGAGK